MEPASILHIETVYWIRKDYLLEPDRVLDKCPMPCAQIGGSRGSLWV